MHSLLEEYTTYILKTTEFCEFVKIEAEQIDVIRFSNSSVRDNAMWMNFKATAMLKKGDRVVELSFNTLDKGLITDLVKNAVIQLNNSNMPVPRIAANTSNASIKKSHVERRSGLVYENVDNRRRLESIYKGFQQLNPGQLAFGVNEYSSRYISVGHRGQLIKIGENRIYHLNVVIHGKDNASGNVSISSYLDLNSDQVESCFEKAIYRTELDNSREDLKPGKYTVLLEPKAFSSLITNSLSKAVSAKSCINGKSFLSESIGKCLFSPQLTLVDDCNSSKTQNFSFDLEGTQRQKIVLIENGVFMNVLTDIQTAKAMKIERTGHASGDELIGPVPSGLTVSKGVMANEALIQNTDDGVLISNFHYINSLDSRNRFLTGTTRGGTYRIKEGRIVSAVKNMRFTEDIMKVLNHVECLSSESETILTSYGSNYLPLAKISEFNFD